MSSPAHVQFSAYVPEDPALTYTWKNTGPASLNLQNFLLNLRDGEVMIPRDVVYSAATEFISRYPGAKSIELEFSVTVTDTTGATDTASGKVDLALQLEPPFLALNSADSFSIQKHESVNLSVIPDYCPFVATLFDPGVSLQWTASCPNDPRTADQLLRLSADETTASVRPYTLTPGYRYTISATLRYTSDATLSASKEFTIAVGTDSVQIRIQYAPHPSRSERGSKAGRVTLDANRASHREEPTAVTEEATLSADGTTLPGRDTL
ncbi:uncharacterized protein LOC34621456 [Cyclospora cayetanensis]|uniref:Uncharacterized protein LOC34621456 n=1 Tax=Cyclospora cayetanensis TaxID=88456 RepID=A0A6P6RV80_9EIME|nr:uncharacterized protein LOC34621456 [Cyclospora cayetanensis]